VPSGCDEPVDLLRGPSTLRPDRDHDLPRQRVAQDVTQDVGQRCRTGHGDEAHRTGLCRARRERPGRDRVIDRNESHAARLLERGGGDRAPALDDGLRSARVRPTLRALGDDGDEPIDPQLAGGAHGVLGATSLRERLGEHEPHPGRRRDDGVGAQPGTVAHELRVGRRTGPVGQAERVPLREPQHATKVMDPVLREGDDRTCDSARERLGHEHVRGDAHGRTTSTTRPSPGASPRCSAH
jgi:hypothetical protein